MNTLLIGVMSVVTPRLNPSERSHHMKDKLQGGSTPNQSTSSQPSPEQMDEAALRELYRLLLALKGKPLRKDGEVVNEQ